MNRQGEIPRSRGGVCGVLLILLGLWGGLAPFVGPYFHFGFTPDKAWAYNSGRLYYSIIPGAAALVGGVLVTATRYRAVGVIGSVLGVLGGAWFVVGAGFVISVLKRTISLGDPIVPAGAQPIRTYLEGISMFAGLGVLILVAGAVAIGRFSMVAAQDVADTADGSSYDSDYPSASAYQATSTASQYPTAAGHFAGTDADPMAQTVGHPAGNDPFPPAPRPDTTASHYLPPESAP